MEIHNLYPLVICDIAIENDHRNSWLSLFFTWWFSIVFCIRLPEGKHGDFSRSGSQVLQGGAPLVINWFINPINYRYITYKPLLLELFAPTERYRLGTPPFFGWQDEFRDVLPLTNWWEWLGLIKIDVYIPSGKHLHNYGKSPFWMGKLTISMAIFNSYVKLPEGSWLGKSPLVHHRSFSTCDFPAWRHVAIPMISPFYIPPRLRWITLTILYIYRIQIIYH